MAAEVASQPASYSSVVCNNKEDTTNMPLDISPDDSKENVQPPAEQNDVLDASADKDDEGGKGKQSNQQKHFIPAPPPKYNVWKQRMEVPSQEPQPGEDSPLPKANAGRDANGPRSKANSNSVHKQRPAGSGTPKGPKTPQTRNRVESRRRQNRREGDHARKTDAGPHGKSEASEPLREQKNETSNARKIEAAPPPKVNVWMKPVAHNEHNEVTFGESQPQPVVGKYLCE